MFCPLQSGHGAGLHRGQHSSVRGQRRPFRPRRPLLRAHSDTHLSSFVPPGWAGLRSSDVVIALACDGPGCMGPSSSARTPHGCLQAGDTSSGCPGPEQPPRCSRVLERRLAAGSSTSTTPRCQQRVRPGSCSDRSVIRQDETGSRRRSRGSGCRLPTGLWSPRRRGAASRGAGEKCVRQGLSAPQHPAK